MADDQAEQKLDRFISDLQSLGYTVAKVPKSRRIYSINGSRWNIRSRGKAERIGRDRIFWYDISPDILKEVKGIIFLTTESDNFMMLPTQKLESLIDLMYGNKRNTRKVFKIDWDASGILLNDKMEGVKAYNLKEKDYPNF
jgi:hypothetical protein